MTDVFAPFLQIRIINLPARRDRRRQMEAELRRAGLGADPRVAFFPGIVSPDHAPFRARGEKGVFLSHLSILREAAKAGASVLILEDDADFTPAVTMASPDPQAAPLCECVGKQPSSRYSSSGW